LHRIKRKRREREEVARLAGGEKGGGGATMADQPKLTGVERLAAIELRFLNRTAQETQESEANPFLAISAVREAVSVVVHGGATAGSPEHAGNAPRVTKSHGKS